VSLELELQLDRLRRERIVAMFACVACLAGAGLFFALFGERSFGQPIKTATGTLQFELTWGAWLKMNVIGLGLAAGGLVFLVRFVILSREAHRTRRQLVEQLPRATIVER
jgi:hypothetical protein